MPSATVAEQRPQKGLFERILSPIADVRRDETVSVLLLTLMMFLMLSGYYIDRKSVV